MDITSIQTQAVAEIRSSSLIQLERLRTKYLGRKGEVNRYVQSLNKEALKVQGKTIKETKEAISAAIDARIKELSQTHTPSVDVTLPGDKPALGHLHVITEAVKEIEDIFLSLGFVRRRYPEVETDWYYAEGLNIPKDHPARDDQETFYLSDEVVLTAHTSNGQLREMERMGKPPIRMINIGKTYRRQADNVHSPMFHQFEGLMVDEGVTITNLIGVSDYFVRRYFGKDSKTRLRPHHFQFTEPSFEVDITCQVCKGTGKIKSGECPVCKGGWLELGGAGMVHPQVLANGGIDPSRYSGFAFGWGVERVIMMKHKISTNLRDLYQTDLRFLNQANIL